MALSWLRSGQATPGFDYGRLINFDAVPVMELIINDFKRHPYEFSTVDEVAEYLKACGVPPSIATHLSAETTKMTMDIIGSQLPNFSFLSLAKECLLQLSSTATVLSITFLSAVEFDKQNVPNLGY